ncbi:MAG: enoyl-CoA hydratase/isomerase family protein [Deltaproteobacteria bacterium]
MTTVESTEVRCERSGPLASIIVDRPETRNAISRNVMAGLEAILADLEGFPPAVVTIRGAGERAFVSGGDLKEFAAILTLEEAEAMAIRMRAILDRIAGLSSVTIAEINGHALGGGAELATAADLRIAADDVRIGFAQITLGITPAWGGIERLTTLVGRSRALYLLTTGRAVTAAQASEWGLVEEVVQRGDFEERSAQLRAEIAGRPLEALRTIKAIAARVRPSLQVDTESEAVRRFAQSWISDEHWAAVAALDKT